MEFDDLVYKQFIPSQYYFHPSFFEEVFGLTGNHVGAIPDFVNTTAADNSYRLLKRTRGQSYTWDLFLEKVNLYGLIQRLESSASNFTRGLPPEKDFGELPIARIFSDVLRTGSIVRYASTIGDVGDEVLRECFHNGWFHADKFPFPYGDRAIYIFASQLHRWFVEWKLWQFYSNQVASFSLRSKLSLGSLHACSPPTKESAPDTFSDHRKPDIKMNSIVLVSRTPKDSLITFPESGVAKGRVDFYIPSKK